MRKEEKQHPITLYTTAVCPVCQMMRDFLSDMGLDYDEVDVGLNPAARLKLIGKSKRLTVPQTNIRGEWVSGFDPTRILEIITSFHEK
jgi:glutaredoxin